MMFSRHVMLPMAHDVTLPRVIMHMDSQIFGGIMAAYTIVTHPVKDFDVWKSVFDKFETVRKEGGERSAVVLRHADDSNMVTIINTWDTIEAAQAFFSQEELKSAMGEAGVTAPPTFVFANES